MGQSKFSETDGLLQVNPLQEIWNNHFWTDLNQLISLFECTKNIDKEYLLIGLKNTISNGYKLKSINIDNVKIIKDTDIFLSIEQMTEYIINENYDEKTFFVIINKMVNAGINLTNGKKMERQEIYKRIDGERNYQDKIWKTDIDFEKPVGEWLHYIEYHLNKAKTENYFERKENVLAELRKIAAIAVRGMEIHGCPERKEDIEKKVYKIDVGGLDVKDIEAYVKEYVKKFQKSPNVSNCNNHDCECDCNK